MRILFSILCVLFLAACANAGNEPEPNLPQDQEDNLPETETPGSQEEIDSDDLSKEEEDKEEDVMTETKSAIESDFEVKLPTTIEPSTEKNLSTKVSSDEHHYNIIFFESDEPFEINDSRLNQQEPFVIIKGKKYETVEEANERIGYQTIQEGMPEVNLGHGITGFQDAGAGSSFITWQEGRWSFIMRSRNNETGNKMGKNLAKDIVEKLEKQSLPVPYENGAGSFSSGEALDVETNRLAWQEENVVYEVYAADPLVLVDIVTGEWE